jgi:peptidoglycan/xylan/chitin deacetylase (PgdA/CDA1 family)
MLYIAGYFDILRFGQKKRVAILMFHRFSEQKESFKISQHEFDKQIRYMKKKYNFISLANYVDCIYKEKTIPNNPIIITIDDGYADNYYYAFPILKKYGISATIFLTTDFVTTKSWLWADKINYILKHAESDKFKYSLDDKEYVFDISTPGNLHKTQLNLFNHYLALDNKVKDLQISMLADELRVNVPEQVTPEYDSMSWDQITEMSDYGIDFGSHTCSHPICSNLQKDDLYFELHTSKKEIENNIGKSVDLFCYPNGQPNDLNENVINAVKDSGYRAAVTTTFGFNSFEPGNPYTLSRIAYNGDKLDVLARLLTS